MHRSPAWSLSVSIVAVVSALLLASGGTLLAADSSGQFEKVVTPTVIQAVSWGVSPPLQSLKPSTKSPSSGTPRVIPDKPPLPFRSVSTPQLDPLVQKTVSSNLIPSPIVSFDGIPEIDGVQPADPTMDVSPTQILDWKNLSYEILDKSGNVLAGPFEGTAFWTGLPGPCSTFNGGDVLVRWDQFASRWVVSQRAFPGGTQGFHQCVAVSQTSDATGSYFQYDYLYSNTDLNDSPKLGLWPDPNNNGYYFTVRNFVNDTNNFSGMKIIAIDRKEILIGNPGMAMVFDVGKLAPNLDGLLPADLRGPNTPPIGSPETFIGYGNPATDGSASSVIHLFQLRVNFDVQKLSTLTQLPDIPVAAFDPVLANGAPQVGGGTLETLPFSMYRADYRVFSDHDSLLLLHDVNVASACGGPEQGGSRWHEVRGINVSGPPALYQEGTYGPCDNTYRWMGSIAQDAVGNIALGVSASSSGGGIVIDPSVHYTGRLATDPLGTMSQGEGTLLDSTMPFGGLRWGDYSTILADPADQCTMWYTAMYGAGDWKTRIGAFKFPDCVAPNTGTLEGTVSDGMNPIAGASILAGIFGATTDSTGHYSMNLPVNTYSVTASKLGFSPQSVPGVAVTDGGDTVRNFLLVAAPTVNVNGIVTDGSGGGWPLYAKIVITGPGAPTLTLFTDPVTGAYSVNLAQGIVYRFAVTSEGYQPGGGSVPLPPPGPVVENFTLLVDPIACNAPGFSPGVPVLSESFDAGILPPNWTIVNNAGKGTWHINKGASPCRDFIGNMTGGAGPYALIDSDCDGKVTDDASLITPSLDLSGLSAVQLGFDEDYNNDEIGEVADVDVSPDGGTTWNNVLSQKSSVRGPAHIALDISSVGGHSNVKVRFHYYNAHFAWWWQVDDVLVGAPPCMAGPGGLVVGNVRDSNTGAGLNAATVQNLGGGSTKAVATPNDPNLDDGFYILFAPGGPQSFQASQSLYAPQSRNLTVAPNGAQRLDFSLAAGKLSASPSPLVSRVDPGATQGLMLNLTNTGAADAAYHAREINTSVSTAVPTGPFVNAIPWVSEDPTDGTVPGVGLNPAKTVQPNVVPVAVTFDSTGLLPGLRRAQLAVETDTPYPLPNVPLSFTVRFLDVPDSNGFESFIYGVAGAGVMRGGLPNCPNGGLYFCPNNVVTRADMAGYIFRAVHGANTPPPVYRNVFSDVKFDDYNSFYIQGIADDGITKGCGGGRYCPNSVETRAQMAVFTWVGEHGSMPPLPCTGIFADVPCPGGFAVDFIESLAREGVTAGCGGGNYCPSNPITNVQTAVFLARAFHIPIAP